MAEPMCPLEALANEERARSFQEKIPSDLSFEEVVKNTALPVSLPYGKRTSRRLTRAVLQLTRHLLALLPE
jgi:hypothetical protein